MQRRGRGAGRPAYSAAASDPSARSGTTARRSASSSTSSSQWLGSPPRQRSRETAHRALPMPEPSGVAGADVTRQRVRATEAPVVAGKEDAEGVAGLGREMEPAAGGHGGRDALAHDGGEAAATEALLDR